MLDIGTVLAETGESPPCGPNLEHDLSFFELEEAARGKPEQSIGDAVKPGEDPNWSKVVELSQALLARSKDLRVAVHLTRASPAPRASRGWPTGSRSSTGCSSATGTAFIPVLEATTDNDPTERLNALAPLADPEAVVKDVRDSDPGELPRARAAPGPRRGDRAGPAGAAADRRRDTGQALHQIHAQIAAAFASRPGGAAGARARRTSHVHGHPDAGGRARRRASAPRPEAAGAVASRACSRPATWRWAYRSADRGGSDRRGRRPGRDVDRRARSGAASEAVRALDLVCRYLERHEPSNPAPLFIRRAQRLMTKNFLEIVKDLHARQPRATSRGWPASR